VAAGEEPVSDTHRTVPSLILSADLLCMVAPPLEVGVHLSLMPEVVPKRGVDIGQGQGRILFGNGFRGRPLAEGGN
jgi:hypothetical protein